MSEEVEAEVDPEQVVKEIEEPDVPQEDFYLPEETQVALVQEIIRGGLAKVGKTFDGSAYAFVELNCDGKGLTNLFGVLNGYPHLRKVSFARNKIQDVSSLPWIPYLTHLNLQGNLVQNLSCFNIEGSLQFLVSLNLSNNQITRLENVLVPRLQHLNLSANQIDTCVGFSGHHSIQILELRKNKLKSVAGICNMPNLIELYLSENELTGFAELANLPQLKKLYLRKNLIVSLGPVPKLPLLYHLNVRENQIASLDEYKTLLGLPALSSLTTHFNPIAEEKGDSLKKEIIMVLQAIVRVNKEEVNSEERTDAINELKERIAEAERVRKEQEEERQRLAEEEARQAEEARVAAEEARLAAEEARAEEARQAAKQPEGGEQE